MQQEGGARPDDSRPAPNADASDAALIARVARGELAAFECLYRCYYPRLTRFLDRVTRRPRLVEEVLNDTMFVVWNNAHRYNLTSKVSTWVFAIAYRKALKAIKRFDEPVADGSEAEEIAGDPDDGPEDSLQRKEIRRMLDQAMRTLSAEHRAVVELTYYQGYSYHEIAAIMDCPVDTVKTRMFYARRRLRSLISRDAEARP